MADNNLATTKYLDGTGVQALYSTIKRKIARSDSVVSGDWYADNANNIKITENSGKYWNLTDNTLYLSGYQALNNNYASLISTKRTYITTVAEGLGTTSFKDTLHVDAISLGGESTDVLLGNGSSKAINTLDVNFAKTAQTAKTAQKIQSGVTSTTNYYLLGSTESGVDNVGDIPFKSSEVFVDFSNNKTILNAPYFQGTSGAVCFIGTASSAAKLKTTKTGGIMCLLGSTNFMNSDADDIYKYTNFYIEAGGSTLKIPNLTIYVSGDETKQVSLSVNNDKELLLPDNTPTNSNYAVATKKYVDGKVSTAISALNDVLKFKGDIDLESGDRLLKTSYMGDTYIVSEAGTYVGEVCEVGDMVIITKSYTIDPQVDSEFVVIQRNIPGVLTNTEIADLLRNL